MQFSTSTLFASISLITAVIAVPSANGVATDKVDWTCNKYGDYAPNAYCCEPNPDHDFYFNCREMSKTWYKPCPEAYQVRNCCARLHLVNKDDTVIIPKVPSWREIDNIAIRCMDA